MAQRRRNMTIPNTQHVFVAGRTGSGKSECLSAFTAGYDRVACIDIKGEFSWGEYIHPDDVRIITRLAEIDSVEEPKIIYRPHFSEMTQNHYSEFYMWCYDEKNITCVTDELYAVSESANVYPEGLKAIMTRGRSRHVAHWGATQRPSSIPIITMSEASHFFIFDLNMEEDRKRIAKITGTPEMLDKPNTPDTEYLYWYYNVREEHPIKCKIIL